jgi:hypothetical protein
MGVHSSPRDAEPGALALSTWPHPTLSEDACQARSQRFGVHLASDLG